MTVDDQRALAIAAAKGHDVKPDHPTHVTAVRRWTCTNCGRAVLRNGSNVYGGATESACSDTRLVFEGIDRGDPA